MGREREGGDKGDKWQESTDSQAKDIYDNVGAEKAWKDQSKGGQVSGEQALTKTGRVESLSGFVIEDSSFQAKAEAAPLKSQFDTGLELHGRELTQAGLKPENVKHDIKKDADGTIQESSTVKYPDGLEIEVNGTGEHKVGKVTITGTSEVEIKNLPKGYKVHEDGNITNKDGEAVAHVNDDGTVSVKVKGQWLRQGPAGVREDDAPIQSKRDGKVIGHVGD